MGVYKWIKLQLLMEGYQKVEYTWITLSLYNTDCMLNNTVFRVIGCVHENSIISWEHYV